MTERDFLRGLIICREYVLAMQAVADLGLPAALPVVATITMDANAAVDSLNYPRRAVWPMLSLGAQDMLVRARAAYGEAVATAPT